MKNVKFLGIGSVVAVLVLALFTWWLTTNRQPVEVATVDSLKEQPLFESADYSNFIQAGCTEESATSSSLDCSQASFAGKFFCSYYLKPEAWASALSPDKQLLVCRVNDSSENPDSDLSEGERNKVMASTGCWARSYSKYIIKDRDGFKLLKTKDDLAAYAAPINNPAKAMAYMQALTGTPPDYRLEIKNSYRIFAKEIVPSYVEPVSDGFLVRLIDKQSCGCGPHSVYGNNYNLNNDGGWKLASQEKLYEDRNRDSQCAD